MTFNRTELANGQVIVTETGKPKHKAVLDGRQWAELKQRQQFLAASEEYDEAVRAFYAPITEAAEKAEATLKVDTDPLFNVVLKEGVEGTPHECAEVVHLHDHSAILRLIEQDQATAAKRLVWIDENTLAITKA